MLQKFKLCLITIMFISVMLFGINNIYAAETFVPLIRNGQNIYYYNTTTQVMTPNPGEYVENDYEMRATWVATVSNLNMPVATSQAQYQAAFIDVINRVKAAKLNAIFFQTRPMNDAFYDSDYAPWSKYLTGTQGTPLSWDAMSWMVDYAHSEGIEFHAWLNPYRVTTGTASKTFQLSTLAADNWARLNPTMVIADNEGKLILNPGEPAVQTYLLNVVDELITNYDVDGIHFDDYFYSYAGTPLVEDQSAYDTYKLEDQSREDWRRENVNTLVQSVFQLIETENQNNDRDLKFGISPFGIWDNLSSNPLGSNTNGSSSYSVQYADSRKWVKEGWLHYITPQLYWHFDHSVAKYADLIEWWSDVCANTNVSLIPGLGIYRAGNTTTYPGYLFDETAAQINYNSKFSEIKGAALYSVDYISGSAMSAINADYWNVKPLATWEPKTPMPDPSPDLVPLQRGTSSIYYRGTTNPVMTPGINEYQEKDYEMRAIWVPTVWRLWAPELSATPTEAAYKAAYMDLISQVKAQNLNTIFFQVRGFNDAWYDSIYAPYSRYLFGTEGADPGWDVMSWMISYAHAEGIEFHAWLNPYRVTTGTTSKESQLAALDDLNWAKINPTKVIADNNGYLILNPGEPSVRNYLLDVIDELITNYDVDGIHFDDYFYSYSGTPNSEDLASFTAYNPEGLTLADWRRNNIDRLIEAVYQLIENDNQTNGKDLKFGVSPFGVWDNITSNPLGSNTASSSSYQTQFADSRKWVKEGWLHYITPQLYFNFQHSTAPYADALTWWVDVVRGTGVDLIPGHSISSGDSIWSSDEIAAQINFNSQFPEIKGEVFYSSARINGSSITTLSNLYWQTAPLGTFEEFPLASPTVSLSGTKVNDTYQSDVFLTINDINPTYYRLGTNGSWQLYQVPLTFVSNGEYVIYYQSIAENGDQSDLSVTTFTIKKLNHVLPEITVHGEVFGTSYILGATVTLTASNHTIWVAVNHGSIGSWHIYTEPIILDNLEANGTYYIQAKTIDSEGTESDVVTKTVKVVAGLYDNPILAIEGEGTDPIYQSATVSFSHEAPEMVYRINEGEWITYTDPLVFDDEGLYVIEYKNVEEDAILNSKTITIDQSSPETPAIDFDGTYDGERFYLTAVDVTLLTEEEANIRYRFLNEDYLFTSWLTYTGPITFSRNGTNRILFEAIDLAGNVSERGDVLFYIKIPPIEDNLYVVRGGENVTYNGTSTPIELPTIYEEETHQIRAVWVATVSNIDIALYTSEAQYKAIITTMLDTLQKNHINTMFFQVRPMNDAFYDSEYAPWSRYLTGIEGADPGWDILSFIIEEAHNRGIEFHAWLNPYRVSSGTNSKESQLASLSDGNFAKLHPDWVISDLEGHLMLNPGVPEVRTYLYHIIDELMTNYDIDGIHFDDYFYSYSGMQDSQDILTYNLYHTGDISVHDWRRDNVNTLIETVHENIDAFNLNNSRNIKFGISPIGIWRNASNDPLGSNTFGFQSYDEQYADTRKWVKEGWLDYIMPQIYWEFNTAAAQYADVVDWWVDTVMGTGVDLIIGHGFYHYTDGVWDNENELLEQMRYASKFDEIIGHTFFSYRTLLNQDRLVLEAIERLNNYYWTHDVGFTWESDVKYAIISGIEEVDVIIDSSFDPLEGVLVHDLVNGDMIASLDVIGSVNINQSGTYTLTYKVTGSDGKLVERTRRINVIEKSASLSGVEDVTSYVGTSFDPLSGITATDTLLGDLTDNITYTGYYDPNTIGTYVLTYEVTGSDGAIVTGQRSIQLLAATVMISGANDLTIAMGSAFYPLYGISAIRNDIDVTSDLQVTGSVNTVFADDYTLLYTIEDNEGHVFSVSRTITVVIGTAHIDYAGSRNLFIDQFTTFDPLDGVTATDRVSGEISSEINIVGDVDTNTPGTYTIVYLVEGSDGVTFMNYRRITVESVNEEVPNSEGCLSGCSSQMDFIETSIAFGILNLCIIFFGICLVKKKY